MTEYYFILGTLALLVLTYQDLKNKCIVNDRFNWVAMGLCLSLYSHIPHTIWYILGGIPVLMLMRWVFIKFNVVGEADINSFTWIFYGYYIINISSLIIFASIFVFFYIVKTVFMLCLKKKTLPLYPEILATWLITNFLFGFY